VRTWLNQTPVAHRTKMATRESTENKRAWMICNAVHSLKNALPVTKQNKSELSSIQKERRLYLFARH
jgi:hypothetical protein